MWTQEVRPSGSLGLESILGAIQVARVGPELDRIYATAIGTLFEWRCPDAEMVRIDEAVQARRREHKAQWVGFPQKPATRLVDNNCRESTRA